MTRKTTRPAPQYSQPHSARWGAGQWSGGQWRLMSQHQASYRRVLDRIRADSKDAARERSFLCPGFMVPPYIALRFSRAERVQLRRGHLPYQAEVQHDLTRPLRIFFDNGLELRITPRDSLEVRALYYAHPWIIGRRPRRGQKPLPLRPPFEQREELISLRHQPWGAITDPETSHHLRLDLFARRREDPSGEDLLDASICRTIILTAPDCTLTISRPSGCGLSVVASPVGRGRTDNLGGAPAYPILSSQKIQAAMRSNADWVDACHAALPFWRQHGLALAASAGPLLWLLEAGWGRATTLATHGIGKLSCRLRRSPRPKE